MKTTTPQLALHMAQDCTTLARLLKITRTDGTIFRFTDFDQSISFEDSDGATGPGNVAEYLSGAITNDDVWGNTVFLKIPGSEIKATTLSKITIALNQLEGTSPTTILNCCVKKTASGNTTVLSTTPVTFGGSQSPTFPSVGTYTSDVIAEAFDPQFDYWFMYYTEFVAGNDALWSFYTRGVSPTAMDGGAWTGPHDFTQDTNIPDGTTPRTRTDVFFIMTWVGLVPLPTIGVYQATDGVTFTALSNKDDGSPNNTQVSGFLSATGIVDTDVRARLYDNATFKLRAVNWMDLTMLDSKMLAGTIGDIEMKNGLFTTELRGLTQKLTTVIGSLFGPLCRAELFGGGVEGIDPTNHWKCRLNRTDWVQNGTVQSSPDSITIVPYNDQSVGELVMRGSSTPLALAPAGWFNDGLITLTSGSLNGYVFEISSYDGTVLTLFGGSPMPFSPVPGDTFEIEPGCDKTKPTCFAKFNNVINHAGEADIPGLNVIGAVSRSQVTTG